MSTSTTNYGFVKAAGGEKYSRILTNNNLDAIDLAIKNANKPRHVELVLALQSDQPANTPWGPGGLTSMVDPSNSENYSDWFSNPGQNDAVRLAEGVYLATWKIVNKAGDARSIWHSICTDGANATAMNDTSHGRTVTTNVPAGDPFFNHALFNVPSGGQIIYFKYVVGSASTPVAHRIKITKLQD